MDLIECIKSNGLAIGIYLYLTITAYFLTKDPDALFTNKYIYIVLTVIPLLYVFVRGGSMEPKKLAILIVGLIATIYVVNTFFSVFFISSLLQFIVILIVIVALAIFYKLSYNELYKMNNMTGIVANVIFYIPCMLLNLLEYISADFKQAPKVVYLLLAIEALLIGLYFAVPKIMSTVAKTASIKDGTMIVANPIRLDNVSKLTSYVNLQAVQPNPGDIINNKYAISSWVYLIPLSTNTVPYNNDAVIYKFGFHPALMYNGPSGEFKCYYNSATSHSFTMPMQHWNHVVLNYTKSGVDLFVNGTLVHTVPRDPQNEALTMNDVIEVGQDNGLSGGVCNMVYFGRPLLKSEIESIYSLNKDKDPPVPL